MTLLIAGMSHLLLGGAGKVTGVVRRLVDLVVERGHVLVSVVSDAKCEQIAGTGSRADSERGHKQHKQTYRFKLTDI